MKVVLLLVEPSRHLGDDEWSSLRDRLGHELADAHEGLRFIVERAAPESLPRFELKAQRWVRKPEERV